MTQEEKFWFWFKENEYKFEDPTHEKFEEYLDELLEHLHMYNKFLFFEVGGHPDDNEKELIISALGEKEHFEYVYKLVNSTPVIKGWKIIALKPAVSREDRFFRTDYYGVELNTAEIFFIPLENSLNLDLIGLKVLVNKLDESKYEVYYEGILMIINTIVGEKVASEDISYVEVMENDNTENSIAITELPEYIKWKKSL